MSNGKAGPKFRFKTPEEMQIKIDEYFETETVYTISGLAEFLGVRRQTLQKYSEIEKFFGVIDLAKGRVESYNERQLYTPKIAHGVIFSLKNNFKWRDQLDMNTKNEHEHNFPKLTKEEAENAKKAFDDEF